MRILDLNEETTSNILESLLKRSPNSYGEYESRVAAIIEEVRKNRDAAVFSYTKQFDRAEINADNIVVTDEEINEAYATVAPELLDVIRKSWSIFALFTQAVAEFLVHQWRKRHDLRAESHTFG